MIVVVVGLNSQTKTFNDASPRGVDLMMGLLCWLVVGCWVVYEQVVIDGEGAGRKNDPAVDGLRDAFALGESSRRPEEEEREVEEENREEKRKRREGRTDGRVVFTRRVEEGSAGEATGRGAGCRRCRSA
jgi:hypothetical protein